MDPSILRQTHNPSQSRLRVRFVSFRFYGPHYPELNRCLVIIVILCVGRQQLSKAYTNPIVFFIRVP